MKKIVEKVKTHRKVVHAHLKKHHKKYFFGLLSAALLIKIIPAMIAWFATMHFNYSFANEPVWDEAWELSCRGKDGICSSDVWTYNVLIADDAKTITFSNINLHYPDSTDWNNRPETKAWYYWVKIIAPKSDTEHNSTIKIWSHDYTMNDENKDGVTENGRYFLYYWPHVTPDEAKEALSSDGVITKTITANFNEIDTLLTIKIDVKNLTYMNEDDDNIDFQVVNWVITIINWEPVTYTITYTDGVENEEVFADQVTTWLSLLEDTPPFSWTPSRSWYTFSGWNPEILSIVTWNQIYTAIWNEDQSQEQGSGSVQNSGQNLDPDPNQNPGSGSGENSGQNLDPDEPLTCSPWNVIITYPLSWQYLKSENVELKWNLSWTACSGIDFIISLFTWTEYIDLWVVPSNSRRYIYTWITDEKKSTNFAIYYTWDDGERISLSEWKEITFTVDNEKPTITWITYSFTPTRTTVYWLNDQVNVSFEWSEELTWIKVNVLWRYARLISYSWWKYNYTIQLTSSNNTWKFEYSIDYSDLAWNTWEQHYESNTWLVSDTIQPDLSWSMVFTITHWNYKKTTNIASLRMEFTENSNVEFTYILSWWKAWETIKWTNSTLFTADLGKALVDTEDKIYKYALIIEDLVWNKKYYAGTFQLSGNHIENNPRISSSSNIYNTWNSIISALDKELTAYSGCKNKIKTKDQTYPIKSKYNITVKMPEFSNTWLQRNAEDLVKILVWTSWLSKSTLTWLTEKSVSTFNKSLNNYLMAVKIKREPNTCGKTFSLLPSLYTSALLRNLKSYNLIK